jgi:hypothetical protein
MEKGVIMDKEWAEEGEGRIIIESGRGWCRVLDLISLVNRRETTRMNREKPRGTKETRERAREKKGNYSTAGWGQQRQGTG